jgi:hypothetical protein
MRARSAKEACRDLGVMLKAARGACGLRDVSIATGADVATLWRLEHGGGVSLSTFAAVCAWLEVSADALLFER